jgi:N utilization substance protein A
MKFLVLEVRKNSRGPAVLVSRAHPDLVRKMFELEVPEIYEGVVKIESIAREPGSRTKIAVKSSGDDRVDAVGACVGVKGTRVQAIVDEIRGEKVDIVRWDEDPHLYLANALSPAKISRIVYNSSDLSAKVIVPKDQLSLSIGKKGQNARLAARLTGTKIDIMDEEQYAGEERARMEAQFMDFTDGSEPKAPSEGAPVSAGEVPPDMKDEGAVQGMTPTPPELESDGSGVPVIPSSPEATDEPSTIEQAEAGEGNNPE